MATPFDNYPYTNFHELNLAYFIVHFREIFAQWAELYEQMLSWKDDVDTDLAAWKEEQETAMEQWETNLLSELNQWKAQTRLDILDWEVGVIAALDEWKAAFQTLFDSTFSDLTDIKTDAEAARDAALAAQAAAEAAAQTLEDEITEQYTVGENKDYESLSDCLEALKNNNHKKEIHIFGGTYDILDELGGAEYLNNLPAGSTWRTANKVISPNTTIIGHGNVIIKMELPDGTNSTKANLFSPINMQGSCTLRNLTIKAKNCRYCVHAEGTALASFNNSTWRFEDCYIEKSANTIADVYTHAIGLGINDGNFLSIENSIITATDNGCAIAMHDNGDDFAESPVVVFSNSVFKSDIKAVSFRSTPENTVTVIKALFVNCYLEGNVEKTTATSQTRASDVYAVTYLNTKHTNTVSQYIENVIEDVVYEDPEVSISDFQAVQTDIGDLKRVAEYTKAAFTPNGYITTNGSIVDITTVTPANGYQYAVVSCVKGDIFTITGTGSGGLPRLWCFIEADGTSISKADSNATANNLSLIAPTNSAYLVVNAVTSAPVSVLKGMTNRVAAAEISGLYTQTEELRQTTGISDIAFTPRKYITTPAVGQPFTLSMSNSTVQACAYKQCYRGQRFRISGTSSTNSGRSPWCFVDSNMRVVVRHSDSIATTYSDYEVVAPANGYFVTNMMYGDGYTYSAKTGFADMAKVVADNESNITDLSRYTQRPLTLLPSYILNSMSYKPLGAPDTGYFCLITDDGRENGTLGVASYTIPMVIAKGIPCTFALMETSEVFTSASWLATLVDAVANHNCSVAVHGVQHFTEYTEKGLAEYLEDSVDFFKTHGITNIAGAVCPAHIINKMVMAVAGGLMGVVRSGYQGGTSGDKAQYDGIDLDKFCSYYTSGANSNLYGLSSFNIAAKTLAYSKAAIDYAKANNTILIALYHENSTDLPDAEAKTKVEDVLDYAISQGLTFITLGDIAKLPIADPSTY